MIKKILSVLRYLFYIPKQESYYPEKQRKPYCQRVYDMMKWHFKYHSLMLFYNLYGLDIKGADQDSFIDDKSFFRTLKKKNKMGSPFSQVVILRDKLVFWRYMNSIGIRTPEVIAVVVNHTILDPITQGLIACDETFDQDCFIKDVGGQCASFVRRTKTKGEMLLCISNECQNNTSYLIQKKIIQHREISKLYSESVNTLRIITVKRSRTSTPEVFTCLMRIGTHLSGSVDNWAAGGLAVGIQKKGMLKKEAFYKPMYGTRVFSHPDTGIVFEGYEIPFFEEAKELAVKAHSCLENMFAIGWDVAITEEGPLLIEGNDNWEISLQQACDRPLKKEWTQIIR